MSVTPVGVDGAIAGDGKRNDVDIVDEDVVTFAVLGGGKRVPSFMHHGVLGA